MVPGQVMAAMAGGTHHCWTLDEIHAQLGAAGFEPDPSTVFRAVGRLEAEGVIRSVALDGRRGYYEVASGHHEHLVCIGCGDIEAVPCGLVASWVEEIRRTSRFEVDDHQFVLRGRCRRCREADISPSGKPGGGGRR